jgi:polyhydroxyalkanoate synthesis regulator phasin
MNPDTLPELIQRNFRLTLGAASSFFEGLQDAQKRDETLQRLTSDFNGLTQEWVEKGEVTEQEARTFVDNMIFKQGGSTSSPGTTTINTTAVPVTSPDLQAEIKALTEQVIALRAEIEQL